VAADAFPNYKSMLTIDFVVTTSTADQAAAAKIREWDSLKRSGYDVDFKILLFAISNRKYGKEVNPFLLKLKSDRQNLVSEVLKFPIPEPNIPRQY